MQELLMLIVGLPAPVAPVAPPAPRPAVVATVSQSVVVDKNDARLDPDALWAQLAPARLVYVGEKHDEGAHHRVQLEVLKTLHARNPSVGLGMEMFSQDQQGDVDAFLAGRTSDADWRKFWKKAWGFDYELYRPLLEYARDNHVPIRALNAPRALVSKIYKSGLASLTPAERAQLPADIQPVAPGPYRDYIVAAAREHDPNMPADRLQWMLEAMATWNETMASNALAAGAPLVIVAGQGHALFRDGIAGCAARRGAGLQQVVMPYPLDGERRPTAELLQRLNSPGERAQADYFWLLPSD